MFRSTFLTALLIALLTSAARPGLAETRHTTSIDGRAVTWEIHGSGRPVLVMVSGLGDGWVTFSEVAPTLARRATVILYDRPGYGGSAPAPGPRDAKAAVKDLDALLTQTGVSGPVVILGHSLGGLYAEAYAASHPQNVAGLILEESRPAGFTAKCEAAHAGPCKPPAVLGLLMPAGARAELSALDAVMTQVESLTPLAGKPVLVLSRPPSDKPFDRLWDGAQAELAGRYPGARRLTAPAGGHYIHRDSQAWFLDVVGDFLAKIGP